MRVHRIWQRLSFLLLSQSFILIASAGQQNPESQAPVPEPGRIAVTVTVTDHDHHPLTGLKPEDFVLYENGQPQQIISASSNVPACIGLTVDNSGSMRSQAGRVRAALVDLVQAGNPDDRVFVVNFGDSPYLDRDFTSDRALIQEALRRFDPRGGTALYDALIASVGHLAKERGCQKRVLVLVSDGRDNESRQSLSQTLNAVRNANGVVIYVIALPENQVSRGPSAHKIVEELTTATGGRAFFAGDLAKIVRQAAEEIRGQYVITYTPAQAAPESSSAQLKTEVRAPGTKDLVVRTSSGSKADQVVVAGDAQLGYSGCIVGSVLDNEKKPVNGVQVEASPTFQTSAYPNKSHSSAFSDERGEFRIRGLAPGQYRLYTRNERAGYPPTSAPFYQDREPPVMLVSDVCTNIVITMGPKAAVLHVNVVAAGTLMPLPVSIVWLQKGSGQRLGFPQHAQKSEILVPADSEFTMTVGSYPGYQRSQPITVRTLGPGTAQELTVSLEPSVTPPASKPDQ